MTLPIPTLIARLPGLSVSEKALLWAVASHLPGPCTASREALAAEASLSVRTLNRAEASLRSKGLISTEERRPRTTVITVDQEAVRQMSMGHSDPLTGHSDPRRSQGKEESVVSRERAPRALEIEAVWGAFLGTLSEQDRYPITAHDREAIEGALENHTLEVVTDAVQGWREDDWDKRPLYRSPRYTLRDVIKFRDLHRGALKAGNSKRKRRSVSDFTGVENGSRYIWDPERQVHVLVPPKAN